MKKVLLASILAACLGGFGAGPVLAVSIDFVPASQTVFPGEPVTVSIIISGLAAGAPPSLGAFDLDVTFDPTILTPTAAEFGVFLGDPARFEALTALSLLSGIVDLAAVSLLAPSTLDALQPASFVLANIMFMTLAEGTSSLIFSQGILSDAFGRELPAAAGTGSVQVVPEPTSFLLVGLGAIGVGIRAWTRQIKKGKTGSTPHQSD
jgi:PEP-CTERM motif